VFRTSIVGTLYTSISFGCYSGDDHGSTDPTNKLQQYLDTHQHFIHYLER